MKIYEQNYDIFVINRKHFVCSATQVTLEMIMDDNEEYDCKVSFNFTLISRHETKQLLNQISFPYFSEFLIATTCMPK